MQLATKNIGACFSANGIGEELRSTDFFFSKIPQIQIYRTLYFLTEKEGLDEGRVVAFMLTGVSSL
jgi:hypothetical protein